VPAGRDDKIPLWAVLAGRRTWQNTKSAGVVRTAAFVKGRENSNISALFPLKTQNWAVLADGPLRQGIHSNRSGKRRQISNY
jgi:hypothetical protein